MKNGVGRGFEGQIGFGSMEQDKKADWAGETT